MKSFLVNLIYLLLSLFLKYNISLSKERKETEKKKKDTVVQSDILVTCIALRKTITLPKRHPGPASLQAFFHSLVTRTN